MRLMKDQVIEFKDKVYVPGRQTDKQACLDATISIQRSTPIVPFHKTMHSVQH